MKPRHPYEWLCEHCKQHGARIALEDAKNSLSFNQLKGHTDSVIANLRQFGVKPGDAVAYVVPKDYREAVVFLATLTSNAVAVPINRLWKQFQIAKALRGFGARWLIAEERVINALRADPLVAASEVQFIDLKILTSTSACTTSLISPPAKLDAASLILFTSGSTGDPKGVAHSCNSLASWTDSTIEYLGNTREDRIFGFLSLGFGYGLNQFLSALKVGALFRISNAVLTLDAMKEAADWGATGLAGIPQFWREVSSLIHQSSMRGNDLRLRYVTNAGGHLSRDAQFRLKDFLSDTDIIGMYGMTETLRSSYVPAELFETKAGSLGIAVPNAELVLLNEQHELCEPGQPGEIVHSGPTLALGYWRAPEQTAERFRPAPQAKQLPAAERACYTGDIAWQDDDQIFWYQARKDRQVKVRGFRFGPHEVEDEVKTLQTVRDAALISVKDNTQDTVLHLILDAETDDNEALLNQVQQHLRLRLASYMKPDHIHFFQGGFPLTANGKLDHGSLVNFVKRQQVATTI